MGLVALLILVDMLILTTWYLTDPSRCSRSAAAVVKVQADTNCFCFFAKGEKHMQNKLMTKGLTCRTCVFYFTTLVIIGDGETRCLLALSDWCLLLSLLWFVGHHHRCQEGKQHLVGWEVALNSDCFALLHDSESFMKLWETFLYLYLFL